MRPGMIRCRPGKGARVEDVRVGQVLPIPMLGTPSALPTRETRPTFPGLSLSPPCALPIYLAD